MEAESAGIAWMTGIFLGLSERHVDLRDANLTVGTSAGATLAAQLGSTASLDELFRRFVEPSAQSKEIEPDARLLDSFHQFRSTLPSELDPAERIRRIAKWALENPTVPESERRAVVAARLPSHSWPAAEIQIVVVDAHSGEMTVFDRNSQVHLVDAVTASCAVPGIWPPMTIHGRRYVDGGVRSSENADLAKGFARILILSPMGTTLPRIGGNRLNEQIEVLRNAGGKTCLVSPDAKSRKAIGLNPLSLATRRPTAEAGREQGRRIAVDVATFWKSDAPTNSILVD